MENRQASYLRGTAVSGDKLKETQPSWQGPRFELDDGPNSNYGLGIRRTLSTLTLATLIVVGGIGFFHKVLPQIIEANKLKQAAKAKKPAAHEARPPVVNGPGVAAAQPNAAEPNEDAVRKFDEQQREAAEDALSAAQERLQEHLRQFEERRAEHWRRHQEFIERHRNRHEEAIGGQQGLPDGFDRENSEDVNSLQKGPSSPSQPPMPQIRFKNLRG
jgi:hypothetical protein